MILCSNSCQKPLFMVEYIEYCAELADVFGENGNDLMKKIFRKMKMSEMSLEQTVFFWIAVSGIIMSLVEIGRASCRERV